MNLHSEVESVWQAIKQRSHPRRQRYLDYIKQQTESHEANRQPEAIGCSNLAHALASCPSREDGSSISRRVAIITAYNDMLSAHAPYAAYPDQIKAAMRPEGVLALVAGAVPAMCDGITQGRPGMELSLMSRDVVALATAVGLSHDVFDGMVGLATCDKIIPGMLMGMASFAHLPALFTPAGPMATGLSHVAKQAAREQAIEGSLSADRLLAIESQVYHQGGTCTFYGTANTNQMMMEFLGLHVPGASFLHPESKLRLAITEAAAKQLAKSCQHVGGPASLAGILSEAAFVNAMIGILATGGSTNHTLHLPAIAATYGITLTWADFDALARVTPLLARIYPNGDGDINDFQKAGGTASLFKELLAAGLLIDDVQTVCGKGLQQYQKVPELDQSQTLQWVAQSREITAKSKVLRPVSHPFEAEAGLRLLQGNLGRGLVRLSAVPRQYWTISAPAKVFEDVDAVQRSFQQGLLSGDFVLVLRYQGPRSNGMPELHKVINLLAVLQNRGQRVALLTDGRLSGASGKVLAVVHVCPEALDNKAMQRIENGDMIAIDAQASSLAWHSASQKPVDQSVQEVEAKIVGATKVPGTLGYGRELFQSLRKHIGRAEDGASFITNSAE